LTTEWRAKASFTSARVCGGSGREMSSPVIAAPKPVGSGSTWMVR
jgi:hypothetical protein